MAVEALVEMRIKTRGVPKPTVVDPNVRTRNGLAVLHVAAEMDPHDILDPCGESKAYYADHYVCLWQVTEAELVGRWDWSKLADNKNWCHDMVLPALKRRNSTISDTDTLSNT